MKFECQRCGACCKAERGTAKFGLRVFDFEAKNLMRLAASKKIELNLKPCKTIACEKSKKEFAIFYEFMHKDCPFLSEKGCAIYEDRPILCRAFPIITSGKATGEIVRSSACTGNKKIERQDAKSLKEVAECYGDCFHYCEFLENLLECIRVKTEELAKKRVKPCKIKGKYPIEDISENFDIISKEIFEQIRAVGKKNL